MIPDALCSVCHRAHPAETLDARARCSSCLHDLGVADTIPPPARSSRAAAPSDAACPREGCDRPRHPGAPMCLAHWTAMPTAQRARWGLRRPAADCTPVVLLDLSTDPRAAGLCDCGEREPCEGADACEVCAGEAVL